MKAVDPPRFAALQPYRRASCHRPVLPEHPDAAVYAKSAPLAWEWQRRAQVVLARLAEGDDLGCVGAAARRHGGDVSFLGGGGEPCAPFRVTGAHLGGHRFALVALRLQPGVGLPLGGCLRRPCGVKHRHYVPAVLEEPPVFRRTQCRRKGLGSTHAVGRHLLEVRPNVWSVLYSSQCTVAFRGLEKLEPGPFPRFPSRKVLCERSQCSPFLKLGKSCREMVNDGEVIIRPLIDPILPLTNDPAERLLRQSVPLPVARVSAPASSKSFAPGWRPPGINLPPTAKPAARNYTCRLSPPSRKWGSLVTLRQSALVTSQEWQRIPTYGNIVPSHRFSFSVTQRFDKTI